MTEKITSKVQGNILVSIKLMSNPCAVFCMFTFCLEESEKIKSHTGRRKNNHSVSLCQERQVLPEYMILLLLLLLLSSLVTGLFSPVLLLNQRWSPPLRLQASHCSTFRITCDVPSTAVFCSESINYYYYYHHHHHHHPLSLHHKSSWFLKQLRSHQPSTSYSPFCQILSD
jgi:hypothetical protein